MKCEITGQELKHTFLNKIVGTTIRDAKGKKHYIGPSAQQTFKTKEELLKQLK